MSLDSTYMKPRTVFDAKSALKLKLLIKLKHMMKLKQLMKPGTADEAKNS